MLLTPARNIQNKLTLNLTIRQSTAIQLWIKWTPTLYRYPEKSVRIRFYEVSIEGVPRAIIHRAVAWIPLSELSAYEVPPANQGVVDMLVGSLGEPKLH